MVCPVMLEPVKLSDASPGPIYPVTRAEAKTHLRVDGTNEDDYIDSLIETATEKLNGWRGSLGGRVLITQTWRVDYDIFPGNRRLALPMDPVQSVTVVYSDGDNVEQTLAASKYALHEDALGAFLWLDEGQDAWPSTFDRKDAVRITMVLGYGPDAADVPRPIRTAILHMVAHWWRNREPVAMGREPAEIPMMAEDILADFTNARFG